MPTLTSLTVRTNSVDTLGPDKLWSWINDIIPNPGLEKFKLHAFTMNNARYADTITPGDLGGDGTMMPRMFLMDLAKVHASSLKEFDIGTVELTMSNVRLLKTSFEKLEVLACAVAVPEVVSHVLGRRCEHDIDAHSIKSAIQLMISGARNLHTLKLSVHWIPYVTHTLKLGRELLAPKASPGHFHLQGTTFSLQTATEMMLSPNNPKLRNIEIGRQQFTVSVPLASI